MNEIDDIPLVPGGLPLLGHALPLLRDPLGFLAALADRGPLCRLRVAAQQVVVVCDPALAWKVFADDRTYDKGGPFYERSREVAGDGLGTCPHSRHRRQRKLCAPAFRTDRVRGYAGIMVGAIDDTIGGWHDGEVVDVSDELSTMTFAVAVETMFSTSLSQRQIRDVAADLRAIAAGLFRRTVLPGWINGLPTPGNRRYNAAARRVRTLAAEVIAERRADEHDRGDLLSALIRAGGADGETGWSDVELVDQVFTFFLAGAETTASCVLWALYSLDRRPETLRAVQREVDEVLAGRAAAPADLSRLPLVSNVIDETLRLYPPGWLLTRVVASDTELDGVRLPAGSTVAVSPHIIHRNRELYDDPDTFAPERWTDPDLRRKPYLPFGIGARRCIGEQFGRIEAGLTLATVLARWRLSAVAPLPATLPLSQLPAPRALAMRPIRREPSVSPV
ncbi:cytochrome P450 [Nocardia sp. NPDC004068]|uniref:cytochrome P450 n=1 Tax=Nocardia sp. NPDC004068 TaxID=3364303 RepID=UPI0036B2907A